MPCSGSSTSPLPVMISEVSRSATASMASRRRSTRSVRQSLASSMAARTRLPWCFSSLASKRSNRVKASAVAPAKPASTLPWYSRAHLARAALDDDVAQRDLAVAADARRQLAAAHADDGGAVKLFHVDCRYPAGAEARPSRARRAASLRSRNPLILDGRVVGNADRRRRRRPRGGGHRRTDAVATFTVCRASDPVQQVARGGEVDADQGAHEDDARCLADSAPVLRQAAADVAES